MKTTDFIKKLNDPAIAQKMSEAKTPQDAYAVAKANGVTDSYEAFVAEMEKLKASVGELSENDLAAVAGGMTSSEISQVVTATIGATAAAAGPAMAAAV